MSDARPAVRYACVGPSSIALAGSATAVALGTGIAWHAPSLYLAAAFAAGAGVMNARSVVVVDDAGVTLSMQGRFFSARIEHDEIVSFDATRYHGWMRGCFTTAERRSWIVRGGPALAIVARGVRYLISADAPETICEEIRRRRALGGFTV